MKYLYSKLIFFLFAFLLSACNLEHNIDISDQHIPGLTEVQTYLCDSVTDDSMTLKASGIPYLQNEFVLTPANGNICGLYFQLSMEEYLLPFMAGNNTGPSLLGATFGLKASGLEVKEMDVEAETMQGRYLDVYDEGRYTGLVYASEKGNKSVVFYIFGIDAEDKSKVFGFLRSIEKSYYQSEQG